MRHLLSNLWGLLFHHGMRKGKQSKHLGKRVYPKSPRKNPSGGSYAHTTPAERTQVLSLRQQGMSVHGIARDIGRSSRTVHNILSEYGTREIPPRGQPPSAEGPSDPSGIPRSPRRWRYRSKPSSGRTDERGPPRRLALKNKLFEVAARHIHDDPEMARQVVAAHLGITLPAPSKPSMDDIVLKEISENAELRREWAEQYLQRMNKNRRTELDILGEGVTLILSCAEYMNKGRWPEAVKELIKSGDVSKLVQTFVSALANRDVPHDQAPPFGSAVQDDATPIRPPKPEISRDAWRKVLGDLPPGHALPGQRPNSAQEEPNMPGPSGVSSSVSDVKNHDVPRTPKITGETYGPP